MENQDAVLVHLLYIKEKVDGLDTKFTSFEKKCDEKHNHVDCRISSCEGDIKAVKAEYKIWSGIIGVIATIFATIIAALISIFERR